MLRKLLAFSSRRQCFFGLNYLIMRHHYFILICCLLLSLGQVSGTDEDRLKFYYNIAEGNYMIGDLGGAERGIEQSLRLDPNHARSLALQAKVRLDQSKPEAALLAAKKAIEADPDKLEYQVLRALILGNLNRRAEAMQQIDAVLKLAEPSSQDALTAQQLKGLLNLADERWDEAATAFKKTYEAQPEASQTGRQLATEAYLEKARTSPNFKDALAAMDEAIALYADQTGSENLQAADRLRLMRARLLAQEGQIQRAIPSLQKIGYRYPRLYLCRSGRLDRPRRFDPTHRKESSPRRRRALPGRPSRPVSRPRRHCTHQIRRSSEAEPGSSQFSTAHT